MSPSLVNYQWINYFKSYSRVQTFQTPLGSYPYDPFVKRRNMKCCFLCFDRLRRDYLLTRHHLLYMNDPKIRNLMIPRSVQWKYEIFFYITEKFHSNKNIEILRTLSFVLRLHSPKFPLSPINSHNSLIGRRRSLLVFVKRSIVPSH